MPYFEMCEDCPDVKNVLSICSWAAAEHLLMFLEGAFLPWAKPLGRLCHRGVMPKAGKRNYQRAPKDQDKSLCLGLRQVPLGEKGLVLSPKHTCPLGALLGVSTKGATKRRPSKGRKTIRLVLLECGNRRQAGPLLPDATEAYLAHCSLQFYASEPLRGVWTGAKAEWYLWLIYRGCPIFLGGSHWTGVLILPFFRGCCLRDWRTRKSQNGQKPPHWALTLSQRLPFAWDMSLFCLFYFPLFVVKGTYHYWTYFFQGS